MTKRYPDTKPLHDTPEAKAAAQSGGFLTYARLAAPLGRNGGCGSLTHVVGTNGGKMPCGSLLTEFGIKAPYYCGACQSTKEQPT